MTAKGSNNFFVGQPNQTGNQFEPRPFHANPPAKARANGAGEGADAVGRGQPRRAASMAATSIFCIVIMASNARLA